MRRAIPEDCHRTNAFSSKFLSIESVKDAARDFNVAIFTYYVLEIIC